METEWITDQSRECISCGWKLNDPDVLIGDQLPSAIFLNIESTELQELRASSLDLCQCSNPECSLVQLKTQINMDIVYKHYPYQSGTTATMRSILSDVVDEALERVQLSPNDVVLDIGGNDGSLLNCISHKLRARVNIDIADGIEQIEMGDDYIYVNSKFSKNEYLKLELPKPRIIFCTAVFYQLQDPKMFCENIREIMDGQSLFIMQMTYLGSMFENNIYDNIVHEHAAYYSLFSLNSLLVSCGLKLVGVRIVQSYGGSMRVYITRDDSKTDCSKFRFDIDEIRRNELSEGVNSATALRKFGAEFKVWQKSARDLIDLQFLKDGPIVGMGASTKGNMMLQALGIDSRVMPFIMDNNRKKIGMKTTGSNIPIVDERSITTLPTNILILPYYYRDFFMRKIESEIQAGQKINIIDILPMPNVTELRGQAGE